MIHHTNVVVFLMTLLPTKLIIPQNIFHISETLSRGELDEEHRKSRDRVRNN